MKELEALSTYPEPEGFHARRLEALQAELKEASSSTAEQQAHIKQVGHMDFFNFFSAHLVR